MNAAVMEALGGRIIETEGGCHEFTGMRDSNGYGRVKRKGKRYSTHRVAYAAANGPIPEGLVVCHSCDNPPCVNPDHLWLGTHGDNHRDKIAKGRGRKGGVKSQIAKTHCPHGHEYSPENTRISNGSRNCRTCQRERARRDYRERDGAAKARAYRARKRADLGPIGGAE